MFGPGTAVSASDTFLTTVCFCQQKHAELRAEVVVEVRGPMSEGNVCMCAEMCVHTWRVRQMHTRASLHALMLRTNYSQDNNNTWYLT